jgi:D-alanyl-D-alanine carboxypeptidase
MCSDNVATRVLARESGLAFGDFMARMNAKALEIGLKDAHFVDPTGLDENNVATASDVAHMLQTAAGNPLIHSITTTASYEFSTGRRDHQINNTNRLLKSRYQILGGKTGYISESGYCFATWLRADGRDLIAVVLGAPTNATRFADVVRLIQRTVAAGFQPTAKS